jgi:hypothetical protein
MSEDRDLWNFAHVLKNTAARAQGIVEEGEEIAEVMLIAVKGNGFKMLPAKRSTENEIIEWVKKHVAQGYELAGLVRYTSSANARKKHVDIAIQIWEPALAPMLRKAQEFISSQWRMN